jgi:hypothetical protein
MRSDSHTRVPRDADGCETVSVATLNPSAVRNKGTLQSRPGRNARCHKSTPFDDPCCARNMSMATPPRGTFLAVGLDSNLEGWDS